MRTALRIIFFPVAVGFFMIPALNWYFRWLFGWLRYGGDFMIYDKKQNEKSIYNLIKKVEELTNEKS